MKVHEQVALWGAALIAYIAFLLVLALGIGYVALHFIVKFW